MEWISGDLAPCFRPSRCIWMLLKHFDGSSSGNILLNRNIRAFLHKVYVVEFLDAVTRQSYCAVMWAADPFGPQEFVMAITGQEVDAFYFWLVMKAEEEGVCL